MRTARAKMRNAHRHLGEVSALLLQSLEPRDAPLQFLAAVIFQQPAADGDGDALASSAPLTGNSHWPFSSFLPMHSG